MRPCFVMCVVLLVASVRLTAQGVVSGVVRAAETGEAIIGANVLVTGSASGSATNRAGQFSIPGLPFGRHTLRISAVGFRTDSVTVVLSAEHADGRLIISLQPMAVEMHEVTIEGARAADLTTRISAVDVPMALVTRLPSLGGEPDLFRALQLLPGVKASSELTSGLYIRGGGPDQNLILCDGIPLYNPSHLAGFMSTINSDAVKHVTLIKGAMPAEYGGRLSSVVDIALKDGSRDAVHGEAGVSLIDGRLTLEGPVSHDATFMVSGRRVYLDALIPLIVDSKLGYSFYDLLGKSAVTLGESDRITFSGCLGRDLWSDSTEGYDMYDVDWGNTAGAVRWMHTASSRLFTTATFLVSDYSLASHIVRDDIDYRSRTGIRDYSLRAEAEYFPSAGHAMKAGAEIIAHDFEATADGHLRHFGDYPLYPSRTRGTEAAVFVQDEWSPAAPCSLELGGRILYYDRGRFLRAEPRLSASWALDDGTRLTAAFAGANQVLHLVSRNDLSLPTDMWFPASATLPPSWSLQYVIGASRGFVDDTYTASIEAYYRSMRNLLEFRSNAEFTISAPLASELCSGSGRAYGAELFVQKRAGAFTGWIGYTLSWTERTFAELNGGRPFPPRYDRRHDASVVCCYRFNDRWDASATWVYGTGQAYTAEIAQYIANGSPVFLYSDRNGCRMPAAHRLDLNATHSFTWFGLRWKASFNVYNVYNYRLPYYRYVHMKSNANGSGTPELVQYTLFPILPSVGLSCVF